MKIHFTLLFIVSVKSGSDIKYSPVKPRPLNENVANSFNGATYTEKALSISRTPQGGGLQSQLNLALNPAWGNTTKNIGRVIVPKGTTINEGFAAPQNILYSLGNVIGKLSGGGNQIYVPKIDGRWFL